MIFSFLKNQVTSCGRTIAIILHDNRFPIMRIYFHFLYLSILTVVWCGFYYWQTTKTNGWWKNIHSLGAVNLAQVMHTNTGWLKEIKKMHSDYPSLQIDKYYERSHQVMNLLEGAMKEIPAMEEEQFWAYRTDHYEFLMAQVDNDQTAVHAINNAIFPDAENDNWAVQIFPLHKDIVLEEFKLRLALSGICTQQYFMTRYHFCGGVIYDKFLP